MEYNIDIYLSLGGGHWYFFKICLLSVQLVFTAINGTYAKCGLICRSFFFKYDLLSMPHYLH